MQNSTDNTTPLQCPPYYYTQTERMDIEQLKDQHKRCAGSRRRNRERTFLNITYINIHIIQMQTTQIDIV